MSHARGFSLLEMTVAIAVFATVLGTVAAGLVRDNQAQQAILAHTGPVMKLRSAMNRVAADLRMAGLWGEDRDHDGYLDSGEDINGNGVLDADWSLAEGVTETTLSFNARTDLRDGTDVIATGIYDARTTYKFVDGNLIREQLVYDDEGNASVRKAVLAEDVKSVEFSRSGRVVTCRASVDIPMGGSVIQTRTLETRIWLRN